MGLQRSAYYKTTNIICTVQLVRRLQGALQYLLWKVWNMSGIKKKKKVSFQKNFIKLPKYYWWYSILSTTVSVQIFFPILLLLFCCMQSHVPCSEQNNAQHALSLCWAFLSASHTIRWCNPPLYHFRECSTNKSHSNKEATVVKTSLLQYPIVVKRI